MRYPFQVIKEWQIPLTPLPKTYPATAAFLELMVTLDELFDEFPAVLRLPEGTALTLLYRDVVYSDQDILNSVGGLACHISETCSLTFYGTTEHRETAEMTVRPGSSPKKGRVLTRSLFRPPHPAPARAGGPSGPGRPGRRRPSHRDGPGAGGQRRTLGGGLPTA